MTENERVKAVRIEKGLTMEKFGEKLGVQKSAISKIEHGDNSVSDQIRTAICREFNVREEWLRDGTGEMFSQGFSEQLLALAAKYNLPESSVVMVEKFVTLTPDEQKMVFNYLESVVDAFRASNETSSAGSSLPYPVVKTSENVDNAAESADDTAIDAEVEEYRRQLLEEKKAEEGSSALESA